MSDELSVVRGRVHKLNIGSQRDDVISKTKGEKQGKKKNESYEFDSESFDHFACFINDELVAGAFRSVRFKEGDEIIAIICKEDDNESCCIAALEVKSMLLHLQMMMHAGAFHTAFTPMKWLGIFGFAMWIFSLILILFSNAKHFIEFALVCAGSLIAFITPLWLWDYFAGSGRIQGQFNSAVFKLLGFKNPSFVNLKSKSLLHLHGDSKGECVYEVGELLVDSVSSSTP
jgi:hypothetical protein